MFNGIPSHPREHALRHSTFTTIRASLDAGWSRVYLNTLVPLTHRSRGLHPTLPSMQYLHTIPRENGQGLPCLVIPSRVPLVRSTRVSHNTRVATHGWTLSSCEHGGAQHTFQAQACQHRADPMVPGHNPGPAPVSRSSGALHCWPHDERSTISPSVTNRR